MGKRNYELSNHLGNVLAVITDNVGMQGSDVWAKVINTSDYYPFGLEMEGRTYTDAEAYRYGFNGQEKVDEIGSGHYTALHWEYDSRIARRWNRDPVTKPWQSDYAVLSNGPIWRMDPNGDDDIFSPDGKFIRHVNNGTNNIIIQQGKTLLSIKKFDGSDSWFSLQDNDNRKMMAGIARHYAKRVGITGKVGIDYGDENKHALAYYDPSDNGIWTTLDNGYWHDLLVDSYNYKSVLEHEKFHKQEGPDHLTTYSSHLKVYIKQLASSTFAKTTLDFQIGMTFNFLEYLEQAKYEGETGWEKLIDEFNKTNTAGFTAKDRDSGGIQLFDNKGKEIDRPLSKKRYNSH